MIERTRTEIDEILRHLVLVGFGALIGWTAACAYGVVGASWDVDRNGALRFLLAILIVTFAHRTFDEIQAWRMAKTPVEERLGFAGPVWENPRAAEHPDQASQQELDPTVEGSPQPPQ